MTNIENYAYQGIIDNNELTNCLNDSHFNAVRGQGSLQINYKTLRDYLNNTFMVTINPNFTTNTLQNR